MPSVEEALARLSRVVQNTVEWIMAEEMADAARAARDKDKEEAAAAPEDSPPVDD